MKNIYKGSYTNVKITKRILDPIRNKNHTKPVI